MWSSAEAKALYVLELHRRRQRLRSYIGPRPFTMGGFRRGGLSRGQRKTYLVASDSRWIDTAVPPLTEREIIEMDAVLGWHEPSDF